MPEELAVSLRRENIPDHLLPAVLKPADKRLLDHLSDWPWITRADLGGMMGLSRSGVSKLTSRLGWLGLVTAATPGGAEAAGPEPPGVVPAGPPGPGLGVHGGTAVVRGTR